MKALKPDEKQQIEVNSEIRIKPGLMMGEKDVLEAKKRVGVNIREEEGVLDVNPEYPNFGMFRQPGVVIHLYVTAPPDTPLRAENVNGRIQVERMESDLELTNVNGEIITLACTGFLITDSVNGDIGIYKVRKGVKASAVNGAIQTQFEQDRIENVISARKRSISVALMGAI